MSRKQIKKRQKYEAKLKRKLESLYAQREIVFNQLIALKRYKDDKKTTNGYDEGR